MVIVTAKCVSHEVYVLHVTPDPRLVEVRFKIEVSMLVFGPTMLTPWQGVLWNGRTGPITVDRDRFAQLVLRLSSPDLFRQLVGTDDEALRQLRAPWGGSSI